MSERDIALDKVQKAMKENADEIKANTLNATWCEANIGAYESRIENEKNLYNDRINKLNLQINRAVTNAKKTHDRLDELLEEKESLHLELKKASHFGMDQCEYCMKFFTPQGIKRHQDSCASKPEIKQEKKHKAEVVEIKEDVEAKKAALKKQLAELEKKGD